MDEKQIRLQVAELAKPSLAHFFYHALQLWIPIALAIGVYVRWPSVFTFLASSVVIGLSLHGLIVMGHDAVHFSVTRRKWLNDILGNFVCFYPLGLTVSAYREFHFPHHKEPTSESDPEMPLRRDLGGNWVPEFSMKRGLRLWALSYLGFSLKELGTFVKAMPRGRAIDQVGNLMTLAVGVFIAYKTHHLSVLGLWTFSLATTYFSTMRIQAWHEHSMSTSNDVMTSRYSLPHPLYRLLLPKNVWLHYEHHKYPNVPFYYLEDVRRLDGKDRIFSFDEMVASERASAPVKTQERRAA